MKLIFKQRLISWLDSYDIYNEAGQTVYTVRSQLALGHCLKIFDAQDRGWHRQRADADLPSPV